MVVRCFIPKNVRIVSKNFLTNDVPLSVSRKAGIPYGTSQWSKKIDAACGAVVFDDEFAVVCSLYRSVMTTMKWFPVVVSGSEPKMSIVKNYRALRARNSFR